MPWSCPATSCLPGPILDRSRGAVKYRVGRNGLQGDRDRSQFPRPIQSQGEKPMDSEGFRRHAHALVDWIADYMDGVEQYPVRSQVWAGGMGGDVEAAIIIEGGAGAVELRADPAIVAQHEIDAGRRHHRRTGEH